MENPEEVFAEEAQEEALLSGSQSQNQRDMGRAGAQIHTEFGSESSPLLGASSEPRRRQLHARGKSYERAINEPWTGAHGLSGVPWYRRPSAIWLLPAFFPLCIAFGGIIVPKTYLIQDLICRDLLSDRALRDPTYTFTPVVIGAGNDQCGSDDEVQAKTAIFNLYCSFLSGFFAAIVSPHFGALSDRIGRTKILVLGSLGLFLGELITILVGTYPDSVSVYWMLASSLVDGVLGSFTTLMALVFAYVTDCTAPETRNVAFGYVHATLFGGIALGPLFASMLIKAVRGNIMVPFYFALGCHVFFLIFVGFVVPESLSKERQELAREKYRAELQGVSLRQQIWKGLNIFQPLWVLWPTGEGSSPALRRNLFVLASIDTMMFGVAMGAMQVILIYARKRFGWDAVVASEFLSAANICRVFALLVVLPTVVRIFRGRASAQSAGHKGSDMLDINLIRVAILFDLVGYVGYALTPTGAIMILSAMVAAFGGIGPPTISSSLTKHIPADRTGQVLGASGLLHALARVVAPVVFNLIYSKTVAKFAGTVFLCLASIFVIVFILSWFMKPGVYLKENDPLETTQTYEEE